MAEPPAHPIEALAQRLGLGVQGEVVGTGMGDESRDYYVTVRIRGGRHPGIAPRSRVRITLIPPSEGEEGGGHGD